MRTTELDRETERATEPAKRWRNRWFVDRGYRCDDGSWQSAGNFCGGNIWPSRDVAETRAAILKAWIPTMARRGVHIKYLGAFPVSE